MKYFKTGGCFSLIYILVYFSMSFLVSFIPGSNLSMIVIYLGLLAFTLIYLALCKEDFQKTFRLHRIHPVAVMLLILLVFTLYPFITFINSVSMLFFQDFTSSSVESAIGTNLPLSLLSIAIMPAIVEELIFRGVIYSKLRSARPVKGMILTALLFGFAHMNFNQTIYAICLGFVFALVVELTDSIFASMILHFMFNGLSVVMTYIANRLGSLDALTGTQVSVTVTTCLALLPFALISIVLSLLLIYAIARVSGRLGYAKTWFKKDIRHSLPKNRVTNVSYYITLAICFIFCILMELSSRL